MRFTEVFIPIPSFGRGAWWPIMHFRSWIGFFVEGWLIMGWGRKRHSILFLAQNQHPPRFPIVIRSDPPWLLSRLEAYGFAGYRERRQFQIICRWFNRF